jgi:hypothetical protein
MPTGKSTDAILATQRFARAICVDFKNLYSIFCMRIGIPELLIDRSKVLTRSREFKKEVEGQESGMNDNEISKMRSVDILSSRDSWEYNIELADGQLEGAAE